jgi:hypothetical protein
MKHAREVVDLLVCGNAGNCLLRDFVVDPAEIPTILAFLFPHFPTSGFHTAMNHRALALGEIYAHNAWLRSFHASIYFAV